MITASEVYKAFGSPESRRELILKKLETPVASDGSNPIAALIWGTRFEEVAKRIFEKRTQCKILDVSCVQHPRLSFLGASPDGIIICDDPQRYGRLVEFKCPISRAETEGVPVAYQHQMQLQMECTGIDECEYVEFRFKQVNYNEWVKSELEKGYFVVHEDNKVTYDSLETPNENDQVVYWILNSIKEEFVTKDLNWLSSHEEELISLWNEVLEHRKHGTKPEAPKKNILTFDI
jgi:putative phage-type endonuclease